MIKIIPLLLLTLTVSSYASSGFRKVDHGQVNWTIQKNTLSLEVFRNGQAFETHELYDIQMRRMTMAVASFSDLGRIGGTYLKLDHDVENSEQYVSESLKNLLERELDKIRLNYKILSNENKLSHVACVEKGFFQKKLECSAHFENFIEVELLD